jgi:AcrR family transcriptional regulator
MVQNAPKAARGRPRAYDPEAALARATGAFWRAGYSATSLDTLSEATGMNRPSLYAAFGDKRALYLAALERYTALGSAAMQAALAPGHPLRESLQRVYEAALAFYYPAGETARGCFLIGTAATESVADPEVRARLGAGLREFDRQFEQRLARAQAEGELDAGADAALLAKIASAILHTLALRSRAGDSRASLRATAQAGIELICGKAPAQPTASSGRRRTK